MSTRDDPAGCQDGSVAAQGARLVVDDHGVVVEWSSQAQTLLGYPAEEVLGRRVTVLLTWPGERTDPGASEVRKSAGEPHGPASVRAGARGRHPGMAHGG